MAVKTHSVLLCVQESVPNAKVGFSKAMSAGWIQIEKSSDGGARVFRKVHIFHLDHIASSYAYSIQLICAYWWITVPAYMQVDTVRDNVQMALHAISSGNAEKVPDEQRKDLKRRNLINNMWVVQFCLLDLQYHLHAWCAHCAHMQMNHHSWWKVM